MYQKIVKRSFDIVLSLLALVILSPVLLIVAVAIKIDSRGHVLFTQKRVGLHKTYFMIWKFRTMRIETPKNAPTHQLENPERWITPVGRFLRKMSLDELPQLVNILRGEMSFVGPRPALWNQDDLVAERDRYGANDVKPGLTGWAQINGRDELEIPEKARLDGDYAARVTFAFDCKCFFGTFIKVIRHTGFVEGRAREDHGSPEDNV